MATTSVNNGNEVKTYQHRSLLPDAELLSIPDEEDEADLDETDENESPEKESSSPPILTTGTLVPIRPWSDFSIATTSIPTKKSQSRSRSYNFVQLERALTSACLLQTDDDRTKFEQDYLESLRQNTFNKFLNNYYEKMQNYHDKIRQERALKRARTFTFFDLEKNFRALDPARDIKIVFIDDPITSSTPQITGFRSAASAHPNSALSSQSDDAATDLFYTNQSRRLLQDPSRAREEITLFARRAGERLQERLPHLSSVPHRVKILDQRETIGIADERTLLQMKHKHALTLIGKRRQSVMKMMTQTQKNQIKMEQRQQRTPLIIDGSSCCRELLERANQIEKSIRKEQMRRPQTDVISQKTYSKTMSINSQTSTLSESVTPSFSSCSTPFQDALSIYHVEKAQNVRVILPARPLTAPTKKLAWVNYC